MMSTFYEKEEDKKDKDDSKIYEVTNKDYILVRMNRLRAELKADERQRYRCHIVTLPIQPDIFRAYHYADQNNFSEIYEVSGYDFGHLWLEKNLDEQPDPLLMPKQNQFLSEGGYIEDYMDEQTATARETKRLLVFDSGYECGNLGAVYYRITHLTGGRPATSSDGTQN